MPAGTVDERESAEPDFSTAEEMNCAVLWASGTTARATVPAWPVPCGWCRNMNEGKRRVQPAVVLACRQCSLLQVQAWPPAADYCGARAAPVNYVRPAQGLRADGTGIEPGRLPSGA